MKLGTSFKKVQQDNGTTSKEDMNSHFLRNNGEYQGSHDGMEIYTIKTSDNPFVVMDDKPVVYQMAIKFNWIASLGRDAGEAFREFYTFVQTNGGRTLLDLDAADCLPVGMAFAQAALGLDTEGEQRALNSVSAENAFYCLNKYYERTKDSNVLGTLFSLLNGPRDLMEDGLVEVHVTGMEKATGISREGLFWGEPHTCPEMQPLRDEAYGYRFHICRFLLDQFYDFRRGCIKGSQMTARCLPDQTAIGNMINMCSSMGIQDGGYEEEGRTRYEELCRYCEDALKRC